jgi:proteasome lid subunit RPN8/RPN11
MAGMAEGEAMTLPVQCPAAIVAATISALQDAGRSGNEGIVLWLGKREGGTVQIAQAYVPAHVARRDRFHIQPEGMKALQAHLRSHRWMIGAQVHSHPELAFHSRADDEWAIVRHVGALSIVAPFFARELSVPTFLSDCATYELDAANRWQEVSRIAVANRCEIQWSS